MGPPHSTRDSPSQVTPSQIASKTPSPSLSPAPAPDTSTGTGASASWVPGDLLRCVALLSVATAGLQHGTVGFALMLLVLGATMIPRAAGLGTLLDLTFCGALLAAAWAALLDLYERILHLDLVAHAGVTALLACVATLLTLKWDVWAPEMGRPALLAALVTVTFLVGTALAALWEIGEWIGHTWLDPQIQVGYTDTMTDIIAGTLGSLAMGVWLALRHSRIPTEQVP